MNSTWRWNGNSAVSGNGPFTWKVQLPPVPAGGPYTITIFDGITSVTLIDVMFGDVWLCSGQRCSFPL